MQTVEQRQEIQRLLAPYYEGEVDGRFGPRTFAAMYCLAAGRDFGEGAQRRGAQAAIEFPRAGLTSPLRLAHFLSQAAHETDGFLYSKEIWGPTPAQARYDTRADLGNTPALDGDGKRYLGRGDFEITGLANYRDFGSSIGVDLVNHPELASEPENAVKIAAAYWGRKNLNRKADRDDVVGITRAINGGLNGLNDRLARLRTLKKALRI